MEFGCSLKLEEYTWENALCWGNCQAHYKRAAEGELCGRTVHFLIAAVELIPILGQIASIIEKILITGCHDPSSEVPEVVKKAKPRKKSKGNKTDPMLGAKNRAATKIQAVYRGFIARKKLREELRVKNHAAARIRAIYRRHAVRKKLRNDAALVLQAACRGFIGREDAKWAGLSSYGTESLTNARKTISNNSQIHSYPRAQGGNTAVFLPKDNPKVVLKASGGKSASRLKQINLARTVCKEHHLRHLVVPKAVHYGQFLIEKRLPIGVPGSKEQISLYCENREKFSRAVEEFAELSFRSIIIDITDVNTIYQTLSEAPLGRYDNIPFYIENDEGFIGLIDIEGFATDNSIKYIHHKCRTLVYLFPHHLDAILQVANRFDPNCESFRGDLQKIQEATIKTFKLIYDDHLAFVLEKGITFANPTEMPPIASEQMALITARSVAMFRNMHTGFSDLASEEYFRISREHPTLLLQEGCLGDNPDTTVQLFTRQLPHIVDAFHALLSTHLIEQLENSQDPITSYSQLLSLRSISLTTTSRSFQTFTQFMYDKLVHVFPEEAFEKLGFFYAIQTQIIQELANAGVVSLAHSSPRISDTILVFC